jgi:hypothetical protein
MGVVKRDELIDQAWNHAPLARERATRQAGAELPRGRERDPVEVTDRVAMA